MNIDNSSKKSGTSPKLIGLISLIFVVGIFVVYHFLKTEVGGKDEKETEKEIVKGETKEQIFTIPKECPGPEVAFNMTDVYMRGVVEEGKQVKVRLNWYACNSIERGDVVLYRYSGKFSPVIKRVVGVPGDSFHLVKDKKNKAWNLDINGKLVQSQLSAEPYFFGAEETATLILYEKPRKGKLGKGEVILFSSFPPGDRDSGLFGLISTKDVIGKVEVLHSKIESTENLKPGANSNGESHLNPGGEGSGNLGPTNPALKSGTKVKNSK